MPRRPSISVTETPLPIKGAEWLKKSARARSSLLNKAHRYWRLRGFPYYELSPDQIRTEFQHLLAQDGDSVFLKEGVRGSNVALRLANLFHPCMWSVRVSRYRSPMDIFLDDDLLREALRRSLSIWPDRFGANASCLRRILKSFPSTASVSNFRPTLARAVIGRYSSNRSTVLDFSAGYGGRLVGSLSLERSYIGIEPNPEQVRGLRNTARTMAELKFNSADATILQGCAEDLLPNLPSSIANLVFSSPPYYNWERYSHQPTQSFLRYTTYPEWLDGFLARVIGQSRRILRRRGVLVLNISDGRRKPTPEDVKAIAAERGFRYVEAHRMLIPKVPYLHPRNAQPDKCELLMVFRRS